MVFIGWSAGLVDSLIGLIMPQRGILPSLTSVWFFAGHARGRRNLPNDLELRVFSAILREFSPGLACFKQTMIYEQAAPFRKCRVRHDGGTGRVCKFHRRDDGVTARDG